MKELESLEEFTKKLKIHAVCKADLYDGSNRNHSPDFALRLAIEKLGEVASAMTRPNRMELARAECIDLAHAAYLLYISIDRVIKEA